MASRRTLHRGTHTVLVVLDHIDDGQLHQRSEVEAFKHLALVGRPFAKIGDRNSVIAAIHVAECDPGPQAYLRTDDAMPTEEILFFAEHVHGAALAMRVAI